MRASLAAGLALSLCACSAKPVLYPNDAYRQAGKEAAQEQVKQCEAMADDYVKSDAGKKLAAQTVEGGAVGAAAGAVTGAVFGNLGRGALSGGVAGASIGLVRGLFRAKQPSPVRRAFVDRCLHDRGYDVVGWQ
jgi:outer membrane lipoprotein SlyB